MSISLGGCFAVSVAEGWRLYLEYCGRSPVLGGVSPVTLQRYGAVRDKHVQFCSKHGMVYWRDFNKQMLEAYGNQLSRSSADRTVFFELTLIKSVTNWLIAQKKLPADCKIDYPLRKPQGTDTYCYSAAEVATMVKRCAEAGQQHGRVLGAIRGVRGADGRSNSHGA